MHIQTMWMRFEASECIFWHWKGILTVLMQIQTIRTRIEIFERKFWPFERNSARSNANSNYVNQTRSIRMQILTNRKGFECKFEPLKPNFKDSNGIWTIRKGFEAFECKFSPFKPNSKHLKGIPSIWMQIRTIWTSFEAFECIFWHWKGILTILMQIRTIRTRIETFECKFELFEQELNANSDHSKGIRCVRM